jgi:hypothetical protein
VSTPKAAERLFDGEAVNGIDTRRKSLPASGGTATWTHVSVSAKTGDGIAARTGTAPHVRRAKKDTRKTAAFLKIADPFIDRLLPPPFARKWRYSAKSEFEGSGYSLMRSSTIRPFTVNDLF